MQIRRTLASVAGVVALAAMLQPSTSEAAWRRVHAGTCTATNWLSGLEIDGANYLLSSSTGYRVRGDDGYSRVMAVVCALQDTSEFPKDDISYVDVHTYDSTGEGGNYGRAYLCGSSSTGVGASCGPSETASGSGPKTLRLSTASEIADYTYDAPDDYFTSVRAYLHAGSSASKFMRFQGYRVSD